jgi:hypothetical protein
MHFIAIARATACILISAAAPQAAAQALSLDDAIRIGEARSARLAAQSAAVTAASASSTAPSSSRRSSSSGWRTCRSAGRTKPHARLHG